MQINLSYEFKKWLTKSLIEKRFHDQNPWMESLLKFSVDNCQSEQTLKRIAFSVLFM